MEHKEIKLRIPWPTIRSNGFNFRRLLPTPGNVLFTLVMIALLVAAQTAGALPLARPQAAPTAASTGTIAYQGRLADAAGKALTGTYNMIFRLYDATTGGTPLWSEPWTGSNGVKVSDGLFNVMLGSLTALPQATIAGRSQLFLGITVGTDDEMQPRVQLGSVPFAVQALTVPDGSVTTGKIADGAVTQAKLGADVSLAPPDGSITTAKIADGAVTTAKLDINDGLSVNGNLTATGVARASNGILNGSNGRVAIVYADGTQLLRVICKVACGGDSNDSNHTAYWVWDRGWYAASNGGAVQTAGGRAHLAPPNGALVECLCQPDR